jgi:hypothetical protein
MPRNKIIDSRKEWNDWNQMLANETDEIFAPSPKLSDIKIINKFNVKNPKLRGVKIEATPKSNKWDNTIKHYAKIYGITVLDNKGKMKSVNHLSNDIYDYERRNRPTDGLYPFLKITS